MVGPGKSRTQREKLISKHAGPPKGEPWVWLPLSLLTSPAFTTLSVTAMRLYHRLLAEHAAHAGRENGRLQVSHDQFRAVGCTGDLIADAIDELCFKGLVAVERGRAANGTPHANQYRLTHVGTYEGDGPTNAWQKTTEAACLRWAEDVRAERAKSRTARTVRKIRRSVNTEDCRSVITESGDDTEAA